MTNTNDVLARLKARAVELAQAQPSSKRTPQPRICQCGCGEMTKGGHFKPGHDSKLLQRMLLEERTRIAAEVAKAKAAEAEQANTAAA